MGVDVQASPSLGHNDKVSLTSTDVSN